ncbi:MAG: hypothetical protein O3C52_07985 [Proteobacteria bacterium]|nr:hypothetical protein [Pseudomonadota bacterium]MDA1033289.1 hypothetical protein [Pseudomonadota bacterium]
MRFSLIVLTLLFVSMFPFQASAQTVRQYEECTNMTKGQLAAIAAEDWVEVIVITNRSFSRCANILSEDNKVTRIVTRGIAYYNLNNLASALSDMRLCLSRQYANHECRYWVAAILFEQGDLSGARVEKERARRIAQGVINAGGDTEDELLEIRFARGTLKKLADLPF